MSDKELLKTIQNGIKIIDECIDKCTYDEGIDYLKTIQQNMREQEIKIVKLMALKKALKEVGNNMNILTYRCPADIHTYSMTCKDEWVDMYMQLLFENDVYKVKLNNQVEFISYADYEQWKNENK